MSVFQGKHPYRELSAFFTGANKRRTEQDGDLARFNAEAAAWLAATS